MRPRITIKGLVGSSVTLSSKPMNNGLSWILNDLDSAGRGNKRGKRRKRNEEKGGGRSDEEGKKMKL